MRQRVLHDGPRYRAILGDGEGGGSFLHVGTIRYRDYTRLYISVRIGRRYFRIAPRL